MKTFSQLMMKHGALNQLFQQSQLLKQLEQTLYTQLPTPLNQHCHIANLRGKVLIIHTDSALWATQLRYLIPELINQWQQDISPLSAIDNIEVKVYPSSKKQFPFI
jgi:hypothetical protein